jgi:outer membrane cobalamin receptor
MKCLWWIALGMIHISALAADVTAGQTDEEALSLIYGGERNVSIATGNKQPIRRAPAVATVITAEDIAAMGATDLDDVLETVPGLHVNRAANVYAPLYVVRGIFSQFTPQTLVLQNGIPVTTLLAGNKGNLWGGFPLEHVARIEVIRGPGSALYGADAYSGVINIITKTAADMPGTELGMRAGSFKTWDTWIQHGGQLGPLEVAAFLRLGHSDGHRQVIDADAQSRNDAVFGTQVSLAPGPANTQRDAVDGHLELGLDSWRLRFGLKLRDKLGTGAGTTQALDPAGRGRSERFTADLSWTQPNLAPGWGMGALVSFMHYSQQMPTELVLFPAGTTFPTGTFPQGMIGSPETWERQVRLSVTATYSGLAGHTLRVGVGHDNLHLYKVREFKNFSFDAGGIPTPEPAVIDFTHIAPFMQPHRRKVNYAYLQEEWNFAPDWTLTTGVRHDRFSDSGRTTNPRLALVWEAAQDVTAKLLYGSAFRAPSFNDKFSINNPVNRGGPNVRPETIKTLEAALGWRARENMQVNWNLFRYAMRDIIRAVPNATPGTGSTVRNTGRQTGRGMELELLWDTSHSLRLTGNYALQRSVDEETGMDAGYAPHHHVHARADWRFASGWLGSAQLNWVADRRRAAGDARPKIADYTTVDLTLRSLRGRSNWNLAATVRNVFNANVREPSLAPGLIPNDLPMAPRAFYLQASHAF